MDLLWLWLVWFFDLAISNLMKQSGQYRFIGSSIEPSIGVLDRCRYRDRWMDGWMDGSSHWVFIRYLYRFEGERVCQRWPLASLLVAPTAPLPLHTFQIQTSLFLKWQPLPSSNKIETHGIQYPSILLTHCYTLPDHHSSTALRF